jgi:regulator of protease activity HflC (stomatin/prohibitin superfamily)
MENSITQKKLKIIIRNCVFLTIAILLFIVALSSITVVPAGHKGIVITMGAVEEKVLNEGLRFKIPFMQSIKTLDARIQKYESDAACVSKDMQEVYARVAVNYRIDIQDVDKLYKNIGESYELTILNPAVSECVRSTTAKFTSDDLISKRSEVSKQIKELLIEKLQGKYISIDSLNIISFEFSENFNKAIEDKQIAEQQAIKARHDLEQIRIEAEAKVLMAKAEAEANMLISEADAKAMVLMAEAEAEALKLKNVKITKEMLLLEYIKKWDGKLADSKDNNSIQLPDIP